MLKVTKVSTRNSLRNKVATVSMIIEYHELQIGRRN